MFTYLTQELIIQMEHRVEAVAKTAPKKNFFGSTSANVVY